MKAVDWIRFFNWVKDENIIFNKAVPFNDFCIVTEEMNKMSDGLLDNVHIISNFYMGCDGVEYWDALHYLEDFSIFKNYRWRLPEVYEIVGMMHCGDILNEKNIDLDRYDKIWVSNERLDNRESFLNSPRIIDIHCSDKRYQVKTVNFFERYSLIMIA